MQDTHKEDGISEEFELQSEELQWAKVCAW